MLEVSKVCDTLLLSAGRQLCLRMMVLMQRASDPSQSARVILSCKTQDD